MLGWIVAFALAVQAAPPAAPPQPAPVPDVAEPIAATPPETWRIEAVPPALRERVRREVVAPAGSQSERLQRLADLLFSPRQADLRYQGDATYTVEQTWRTRRGNCVAFTLLFLALAGQAGLDAWPQESDDTLAWQLHDGTLYRTTHVSAAVRIDGRTWRVDAIPEPVIERSPPRRIDRRRLLSHYYNNLAVALLGQGRLADSARYVGAAIAQDPGLAATWSNAGVIALRGGDRATARLRYQHALEIDPDNAGALFNMVGLLEHAGDADELAGYRARLARVQRHDPFHHFLLAMDRERAGDLSGAIGHLRTAVRLMPREYRFHLALANAYREAGDQRRAARSMARARALGGPVLVDAPTRDEARGNAARPPRG